MAQTNTIYFRISPRMEEMLKELLQKTGMITNSELIRQAVSEMHDRMMSGGKTVRPALEKSFLPGRPKGLSKEERKHDEQLNICKILGGEVNADGTGCVFHIYEKTSPKVVSKHEQELPLTHLTQETIRTQYKPSKEECMKVINAALKPKPTSKKKK